jgi:phosphate-selective porin OprO and OprP
MNVLRAALAAGVAVALAGPIPAIAEQPEKPLGTIPVKVGKDKGVFPVKVETDGGLQVETMDGRATFEIEGRFQFDTLFYDGVYNDANGGSWASDTKTRRMRLGVGGKLDSDWEWLYIVDFNNDTGRATLDTGQVTYKGFDLTDVNVGRFKRPFLMEALNSSKWLPMVERSVVYDVTRSHVSDFSVMLSKLYDVGATGKLSWYAAVLNEGVEDYAGAESATGKDQYQYYGRVAWAPWAGKGDALHFGLAYGAINPAAGTTVPITTRLGVSSGNPLVVTYTVDDDQEAGAEALYILGPFSAQAEYVLRQFNLTAGDTADISAGYLTLTWTLTGESRQFKPYPARPDRVLPSGEHSFGAIELVLRGEHADLDQPGLDGATADVVSLGANWYLNSHLHVMLDYLSATADNFGTTDDSGSAVTTRIAFQF